MQSACGVDEHHVIAVFLCVRNARLGDFDRGNAGAHAEHGNAEFFADDLKLLDRGRAVNIAGDQQRVLAFFLIVTGELAAVRGFTRTLQADHHDDRRRGGCDLQFGIFRTHQVNEFFIDNFDDLLCGQQAFRYLCADGTVRDRLHKVLDNLEVDVRLQQCKLDFAHPLPDIRFGELAFALEFLKGIRELFA